MTSAGAPISFNITPTNLDSALRYSAVIDLLDYRPNLSIVEVGSGSGGLTEFLRHRVTGVDLAFERTTDRGTDYLDPVEGSADDLPFPDDSFDVGVSVEMLEHLPGQKREAAVTELVRVVRPGGRVIITFPADELGAQLDAWLNRSFRARTGAEHPWVSEHLTNGHPKTDEIVRWAERSLDGNGTVRVQKHLSPSVFRLVHGLYTVNRGHPMTKVVGLRTNLAARRIFRAVRRQVPADGYRTILVIDKG
ncbi:MAG: hypothetical protein QOJ29_1212 [Thermoleophilaceae bacterium]|nr:hypothetical protein [Thermoleophilaceae bacterium]